MKLPLLFRLICTTPFPANSDLLKKPPIVVLSEAITQRGIITNYEEILSIANGMEVCWIDGKVKSIFVIKELLDCRTRKAGAILACFNWERQTLGTKAKVTSLMETLGKPIEICLKDISKGTEEEALRDKLVGMP